MSSELGNCQTTFIRQFKAIPNIYFNWKGSGFTAQRREQLLDTNTLTAALFFTTLGSWGEKTVQCKQEVTD
jgi:hypothetical protein